MNSVTTDVASTLAELQSVVENLLLLLSDKEKIVVKKRFCLEGSRKFTLEEIGQEFAVTRERIRQIEKNALAKMKRNVFNTALRHLHGYVSDLVVSNGGLMKESEVVRNLNSLNIKARKNFEDEVHFALVLHESLDCIGNTITFHPYVREREMSDYSLRFASNHLVNQLHKYGDIKEIDRIHSDLKDILKEVGFDQARMKSLIAIDKRLTLLDDDMVGLMEWRHIHPRTLRDKILFVLRREGSPLHFNEISDSISEANFDKRPVNVQAVHNELIRHGQFILIGRGIYALKEWGYTKGTVADVVERLLQEKGELSEEEIVKEVLKRRQVKKITILLALKNSEQFERVGRKQYKLKA